MLPLNRNLRYLRMLLTLHLAAMGWTQIYAQPARGDSLAAMAIVCRYDCEITKAAEEHDIPPRLLASVVYAEHLLNVRPGEKFIDVALARSGYNSSIGVAQIKVNTALWTLKEVQTFGSLSRDALVDSLRTPHFNLRIAAAYLRIISGVWTRERVPKGLWPALVATIYTLGLFRADGSLREPGENSKPNAFGLVAGTFFRSEAGAYIWH